MRRKNGPCKEVLADNFVAGKQWELLAKYASFNDKEFLDTITKE